MELSKKANWPHAITRLIGAKNSRTPCPGSVANCLALTRFHRFPSMDSNLAMLLI